MKDRSSNMNIAVILYHSEFLPPFYFLQSKKVGSDTSNAYLPEFCPAERLRYFFFSAVDGRVLVYPYQQRI